MTPERGSAPAGTEAQEKQRPEAWSRKDSPNPLPLQGRDDLIKTAEDLGIAVRIVRRIAEKLPCEQARGATECLIALRLEIARLLAQASRPA